jgi:prepilin-type N-terminal cleavage/methylation domain-containing protein
VNVIRTAHRRRSRGFSLIELLVVIAIIAILAAILFPVFNTVRENMRQATCLHNMTDIVRAMKMYHDDWGVYPDQLYAVSYNGGALENRLNLKKYLDNPEAFTCPNVSPTDRGNNTLSPCVDPRTGTNAVDALGRTLAFPLRDTYDCQRLPTGQRVYNYTLRWQASGNALTEDNRQLYRKEPAPDTVVTWCMLHSGMSGSGAVPNGTKAMVAFLNGSAKKIDAKRLLWPGPPAPWQVTP